MERVAHLEPAGADNVLPGGAYRLSELRGRALAAAGLHRQAYEAFADAIPDEPQSLAALDLPDVVVLRSLTKTWSLAGLRVGYALGAPEVLARLAARRPHWPLGTLQLEAIAACCTPAAVEQARAEAKVLSGLRAQMAAALARLTEPELSDNKEAKITRQPGRVELVTTASLYGAGLGGQLANAINADGSIVVNADDIQVGVLATDGQHGNRGGGGGETCFFCLGGWGGGWRRGEERCLGKVQEGCWIDMCYIADSL
jgi:hypothetical protein